MNDFERMIARYNYNAHVDLAMHSFIPEIRASAWAEAERLGRELGFIKELQS